MTGIDALQLDGARDIADAVRRSRVSAATILESRIERIERMEPRLNCFTLRLTERARREAAAVDALVAAGGDPGPLAGVVFGVKDNYDLTGYATTAGSIINRSLPPAVTDAVVVQRLTRAGAVLVGRQNMDEFAYGFTTENAHYGATRNPRDLLRSAGGSSGGSAAAVAAGLTDFGLGTDTNGSIRVPASFSGVFGLKPTYGRLPRTGTFPFVHDLDHLGLFARRVDDLTLVYDSIRGFDSGDSACSDRAVEPTQTSLFGVDGLRVAVLDGWFDDMADSQGRAAVESVAAALGARRRTTLPGAERARAAAFVLTAASGGELHGEALRSRAVDFDPATRDRLLAGALLPADMILQARRIRRSFHDEVMQVFRHCDVLLAAATPCAATLLGQPTIRLAGRDVPTRPNIGVLTQPLSFVGVPIVAAPVGRGPLPIAVQIIASPWHEATALRVAAHLEAHGVAGMGMADPC